MNAQQDTLAEIDDARVRSLEHRIFGDIDAHRARKSARRHRTGLITAAASLTVLLAVAIGPALSGGVGLAESSGSGSAAVAPEDRALDFQSADRGAAAEDAVGGGTQSGVAEGGTASDGTTADGAVREIIATASATVRADSVADALDLIAATATGLGGYVEKETSSAAGDSVVADPGAGAPDGADSSVGYPVPVVDGAGSITVRVPADRLTEAITSLDEVGSVTASMLDRQDVTTQAIDLRARVAAAQASVDRLTTLLSQAESVADLLTAESALAGRQGELESYQQQLTALESQVGLSTLTVSVLPVEEVTAAEPAGFVDGLLAGWNGLVAALNGTLIGLGFLLPWLLVAGVVGLVVVGLRRGRSARAGRAGGTGRVPGGED